MRRLHLFVLVVMALSLPALPQTSESGDALLSKARGLYDAPFTHNLVSFDCAVNFDWKQHFVDTLGTVPPAALRAIDRLQAVRHRVFVDHTGAVVSTIPTPPDLSGTPHAADLEQVLNAMEAQGVNGWVPFGVNEILPIKPTSFNFEKVGDGYRLTMNGPGVSAALQLDSALRLKSGVSESPQPLRFSTEFINGPDGYQLQTLRTTSPTPSGGQGDAVFTYAYQPLEGFQLPSTITVTPPNNEVWKFALADCKVNKSITIKVAPPPKP
jgi:hypothetical protein